MQLALTYKKGTLVLAGAKPSDGSLLPQGFTWDSRIQRFRAPAFLYRRACMFFAEKYPSFTDEVSSKPPVLTSNSWKEVSLYPYQDAACVLWQAEGGKGIMSLPTGAGKTRTAISAIQRSQSTCLILVPTKALLQQWQVALGEFFTGNIGLLGDGEFRLEELTVSTYESAYRHIANIGDKFGLLVVDEAHHFGMGLRDEILRMSIATKRLGLTASLPLDETHRRRLISLVGPLVYEMTIDDLRGKYLSDFSHIKTEVNLTAHERELYDFHYNRYRAFARDTKSCWHALGWQAFSAFAAKSQTGREALKSLKTARSCVGLCHGKLKSLETILKFHWQEQIFIFVATTAEVCQIAKRLLAYPVVADVKRAERELVLAKFSRGEIRAIVACRVLNEGIDVPTASIAVILGGTGQPREQIQRIGRVLRKRPDKKAIIYELVAKDTFEVYKSHARNGQLN